jgi:hypothetical protein
MVLLVNKVEPLTLTYPNGGEQLNANDTIAVTWETIGDIPEVHVQYTYDEVMWSIIAASITNTGTVDWVVPDVVAPSVKVRVIATTGGIMDESDATFSIVGGSQVGIKQVNDQVILYIAGLARVAVSGEFNYTRVQIADISGKLLRELPINSQRVIWDMTDRNGQQVSQGIYLVRILGSGRPMEHKVMIK